MRISLAALLTLVALAGCGGRPVPDEATSRSLVTAAVLDWHRFQADGNGEAACRLVTERRQDKLVDFNRKFDESAPDSCEEIVDGYRRFASVYRDWMLATEVDAVQVDGERAVATIHTVVPLRGVMQRTPPTQVKLRWDDGRWLID